MFSDMPRPNGGSGGDLKKYYIGSVQTSSATTTINIQSYVPNPSLLTVDNFYYDVNTVNVGATGGGLNFSISKSYNASTGVFTLTRTAGANSTGDLYVFA